MDSQSIGIVTAVLSLIPGIVTASAGERPALVVRTYSINTISNHHLTTAQGFAGAIFRQAGIQVSWIDCGARGLKAPGSSPRCDRALAANEVVLRIGMTGSSEGTRYSSMGESLVSGRSEDAPRFATVFADRVTAIASGASVECGELLGYAIAHEIGHLLLNDLHHPTAGLMRAVWSRAELRWNAPADWLFAATEAESMRAAVVARTPR